MTQAGAGRFGRADAWTVLDALEVGTIVLDAGRRVTVWNAWMERASRISAVDAIGRDFAALFPGVAETRLEGAIDDALTLGAPSVLSDALNPNLLPLRRGDGTPMHHAVTVRSLPGAEASCLVQVADVTASVERERALRLRRDARFRAVVDTAPDAIVTTDLSGRIEWVNPAAERQFARPASDMLGQDIGVLLAEGRERWEAATAASSGAGPREPLELVGLGPNGTTMALEVSLARWGLGSTAFVTGILRDVTARRAAELALRGSEERLRLAVGAARMFFWDWDIASGAVIWPEGLEAAAGLVPGSFDGDMDSFSRLVHAEDLPRIQSALARALAGDGDYDVEFRMVRGDGGIRWVVARAAVLRDESGKPVRMVGIDFDVTSRKLLEQALARANADLERRVSERTRALADAARELAAEMRRREEAQAALLQAQKLEALGQLTGGVAHDFNNVLAAVLGSYRLIRHRTSDPRLLELVRHGEDAAERASALIRQLLAFARREELRPSLTNAATLLPQVETLARHALGSGMRCVIEIEENVWPILVDAHRLEVALLNLVVNARDAMPDGGVVTISARNLPAGADCRFGWRGGDAVVLSVNDTGVGMSPEVLARVSEPFFTTKGPGKGTGLGLAMVRGFTEQSGGQFRVDSAPGAGTTVSMLLPRARPGADGVADPPMPDVELLPRGHGEVLLLAEDDEQVRPITAALLRELGYTVIEAPNAEVAFTLAQATGGLDLVLSDIVMPGADGPTLAARLRAERPELPIVFVTAHTGDAQLPPGAVLLRKPFTQQQLAAIIAEMLRRSAARDLVVAEWPAGTRSG